MWVMVIFDLPCDTADRRRLNAQFRKFLVGRGFAQQQESFYVRWEDAPEAAARCRAEALARAPAHGETAAFVLTDKQMAAAAFRKDGAAVPPPLKPEPWALF